MPNRFFLFG